MEGQTEEQFWSRFSDTYDKDGEYVTGRPVLEAIASRLSREPSSGQALEFGCGTGFFSQAIAQTDGHLLATDLSEAMLKTARRRLGNLPNVTLRKAGCSAGSFAAGSFDSVFLVNLVHVLDDPFPCLRECHRVLRPGGDRGRCPRTPSQPCSAGRASKSRMCSLSGKGRTPSTCGA